MISRCSQSKFQFLLADPSPSGVFRIEKQQPHLIGHSIHLQEHPGIDKVEYEFGEVVRDRVEVEELFHLVPVDGLENRGLRVEEIVTHLRALQIDHRVDGGVEAFLAPVEPNLIVEDSLERFAPARICRIPAGSNGAPEWNRQTGRGTCQDRDSGSPQSKTWS